MRFARRRLRLRKSMSRKSDEWLVYDSEREDFALVRASGQKEAWFRALERDYVGRHTNDVRPRTGDADLMSVGEFDEFLDSQRES